METKILFLCCVGPDKTSCFDCNILTDLEHHLNSEKNILDSFCQSKIRKVISFFVLTEIV